MPQNNLTLCEKQHLFKKFDLLDKFSQREVALKLDIAQTSLSKLLKMRHEIESSCVENENKNRRRKRNGKVKDVEQTFS